MKTKKIIPANYLDNIPVQICQRYNEDEEGIVTLEIENKGFANKLAQKLLKKPKISYIHLDNFGSFVWKNIDGGKSIYDIGKDIEREFGDEINPLYERLAKYFQILSSYGFVSLKNSNQQA